MTIHAAKGLEFPMVVLSGMSSAPNRGRGVQLLWTEDDFVVKVGSGIETEDFAEHQPLDEQMSDLERMRLLYVAATRARDHLVVSLHRGKTPPNAASWSNAMHLADAGAATAADAVRLAWDDELALAARKGATVTPPPELEEWLRRVRASVEVSRRVPAISASGLEGTDPDAVDTKTLRPAALPEAASVTEVAETAVEEVAAGLAKGARDIEQPAWAKGRYGSAVGRAVHGVLQSIDLRTGAGLDDAVAAQCLAEGVVEFADLVTALVRSALAHEIVQRAAAREHWREPYLGTVQDDGTVLEGFADLIYREDDGSLVIVDYKTDDIPDGAIPARTAYYQPQLDAYRQILGAAAEADATGSQLVFLRPGRSSQNS
jgi:ATP-dependent exoDNAse (exonuclease V) beta subunit